MKKQRVFLVQKKMYLAMGLTLLVSLLLLAIKIFSAYKTGSLALFSDAVESVVHVLSLGMLFFSLMLLHKPADSEHSYGHEKVAFFAAGFEGACILGAACLIGYRAILGFKAGSVIVALELGLFCTLLAGGISAFLGVQLTRFGKKNYNLPLEAHGKHLLADGVTSLGIGVGLLTSKLFSISFLDPLIAFGMAMHIFYAGLTLLMKGVHGLMDHVEPALREKVVALLEVHTEKVGISYHALRHRHAGNRLLVEVHLLFPKGLSLAKAHEKATVLEKNLEQALAHPLELITHLEPLEGHDEIHQRLLGREG